MDIDIIEDLSSRPTSLDLASVCEQQPKAQDAPARTPWSNDCVESDRALRAGDLGAAIASAERAVATAATHRASAGFGEPSPEGNQAGQLLPHVILADALVSSGRTRQALRVLSDGRLRFDRPEVSAHAGDAVPPGSRRAALRDASVICNFVAGNWDDALAEVGCRDLDHVDVAWLSARAASSIGVLALHRGDIPGATVASRAAWRRHAAGTDPVDGMYAAWLDSMLADQRGGAGAALPWFIAVLRQLVASDHVGPILALLPDLAHLAIRTDSVAGVQQLFDQLANAFDRASCPAVDGIRWCTSAMLTRSAADAVQAVESSRTGEIPVQHVRACEVAGCIAIDNGDLLSARMYLEEARTAAEHLGASALLHRVHAAQRRAGASPGARGPRLRSTIGWGALTRTERAITELALSGMTNAEVAERLYISRRTVESHMSSVLRKVGVANRAALLHHPDRPDGWPAGQAA